MFFDIVNNEKGWKQNEVTYAAEQLFRGRQERNVT